MKIDCKTESRCHVISNINHNHYLESTCKVAISDVTIIFKKILFEFGVCMDSICNNGVCVYLCNACLWIIIPYAITLHILFMTNLHT